MKNIPSTLVGIILLVSGVLLLLSLVSYNPADLKFLVFPPNDSIQNITGLAGAYVGFFLFSILGYASFIIPVFIILWAIDSFGWVRFWGLARTSVVKTVSFLFLLIFSAAFLGIFASSPQERFLYGGITGYFLSGFFRTYLGFWGAEVLLGGIIVSLLWLLAAVFFEDLFLFFLKLFRTFLGLTEEFLSRIKTKKRKAGEVVTSSSRRRKDESRDSVSIPQKQIKPEIKVYTPRPPSQEPISPVKRKDETFAIKVTASEFNPKTYRLPTVDLLKEPPPFDARELKSNIEANIRNLEKALADFGVGAKVVTVQKGPVVTMYELQPFSGVKIQHITALADDIALAMKSAGVRVVAPIPGRGTVGVEIPNEKKQFVYLREVLEEKDFTTLNSRLALAIGKDVAGAPVVSDLKEMPHLLIAGTTGSGKTICVNSLISSILFKSRPDEVKFILVDPKKVELAYYSGIPHLLHPIISEAKKAFAALNWAVEEMESRYRKLAEEGARNIEVFNSKEFRLPYIVIVVDELADLMAVSKDKIETAIQRLAQLSRAVGIHLILATQRPSVDVITGVIKANFPARISFKVSSKVDSRTVLDMVGADKLLGKGDLLFMKPGFIKPLRAQGCFIDDEDLRRLTDFIKAQGAPMYENSIIEAQKKMEVRLESDELLDEAIKIVLTTRQASASLLQRRLRVGYTRAARLLDLMEQEGIIGPFCGSKAREILVDSNEYLKEKGLV